MRLIAQTHISTDGHGNSMTESNQWAQFSEKRLMIVSRIWIESLSQQQLRF